MQQHQGHRVTVAVAAVVQAIESAGLLLASVLAGVAAINGKSYQNASGIAITIIGFGTAILLGFVAYGLARARRWSRTPALMTQFFVGIVGIYLVQGHRWSWGVPSLVLAVAGLILLLVPPSIRALTNGNEDQSTPSALARSK
jgi:hypothetical protein